MSAGPGKRRCPHCGSSGLIEHHPAKRVGAAFGAVTGMTGSLLTVAGAAEAGAVIGAAAGPAGAIVGSLSGAILASMAATTAGGLIGARLGELCDSHFLDTVQCRTCRRYVNRSSVG